MMQNSKQLRGIWLRREMLQIGRSKVSNSQLWSRVVSSVFFLFFVVVMLTCCVSPLGHKALFVPFQYFCACCVTGKWWSGVIGSQGLWASNYRGRSMWCGRVRVIHLAFGPFVGPNRISLIICCTSNIIITVWVCIFILHCIAYCSFPFTFWYLPCAAAAGLRADDNNRPSIYWPRASPCRVVRVRFLYFCPSRWYWAESKTSWATL